MPESYELWRDEERDAFARVLLREKAAGEPISPRRGRRRGDILDVQEDSRDAQGREVDNSEHVYEQLAT